MLYVAVHNNNYYQSRQLLSHGASSSLLPIDSKSMFAHLIKNNNEMKNNYIETVLGSACENDSMLIIYGCSKS